MYLNQKQIALSCSSHCGEYFHIRELKKWINKTELKISNLKCGIHNPLDNKSAEKLFLSGNRPYQLYNNCAGKHLAMLTACILNKFSINNYLDFDHPHQINIRNIFSKFTEEKILKKKINFFQQVVFNFFLNFKKMKRIFLKFFLTSFFHFFLKNCKKIKRKFFF